MGNTRWQLFRLSGIPIRVDPSWIIILGLLTWSLAGAYPMLVGELPPAVAWGMGLGTAVLFFVCIVLHELGHALVARREGIPIGGITLFLFGGVAELEQEPDSAAKELAMALAGPAVSVVLAGLFWTLYVVGELRAWAALPTALFFLLGWINTAVLVFNMIPAFPLDGGRVLRAILWAISGDLRRATRWATRLGQGLAALLVILGVVSLAAGDLIGGVWLAIIGLFLGRAAQAGYSQVLLRQALRGEPVQRAMTEDPVVVPAYMSLREWIDEVVMRHRLRSFPVVDGGELVGVVSTASLDRVPRERWGTTTVAELMRRDLDGISVPPEADLLDTLEKMQRGGGRYLLVREGGHLEGVVTAEDVMRFFQLKLELNGSRAGGRAAREEALQR